MQRLLAGLLELVPSLEQWHNDIVPEFGHCIGTYYRDFVTEDAQALCFMLDDVRLALVAAKMGRKKKK